MSTPKAGLLKRMRWRLETIAFLGCERIAALFPIAAVWKTGAALSRISILFPDRRKVVAANMRVVLGPGASEEDIERATRDVFRHTFANLLSSLKGAHMSLEAIRDSLEMENGDVFHRALAKGRGLLLLPAHMGSWELLAQITPVFFPDINLCNIYRPLNNPHLDAIVQERRRKNGMSLIPKLTTLHKPIAHLRDGNVLTIFSDQRAGRLGTLCPFFGRLMSMTPIPELIQRRTRCEVLSVSMRTLEPGRWRLKFHEPDVAPGEEFSTAHMAGLLEEVIRESIPDEFWLQDLWGVGHQKPLRIRCRRGPVVLERKKDLAFPQSFNVLLRLPDAPGELAEQLPILATLARSRPDIALHLLGPAAHRATLQEAQLPHHFHAMEEGALPPDAHLAVLFSEDEGAARDLARRFDGPTFSLPALTQASAKNWNTCKIKDGLEGVAKWQAFLRRLKMPDPPMEIEYV